MHFTRSNIFIQLSRALEPVAEVARFNIKEKVRVCKQGMIFTPSLKRSQNQNGFGMLIEGVPHSLLNLNYCYWERMIKDVSSIEDGRTWNKNEFNWRDNESKKDYNISRFALCLVWKPGGQNRGPNDVLLSGN